MPTILTYDELADMYHKAIDFIKQTLNFTTLFFALIGLLGAGTIIFSTTHYNAGASPDSVEYISTARNISNGMGINYWNDSPLLVEPPLYPVVLAMVDFVFNMDPLLSARYINAILFGLIIFLSGLLFAKHLSSSALVCLGLVSVLVSPALVNISIMIWTEALFIFLAMVYLFFSEKYIGTRNIIFLVILALTTSLASLTRYIGIILIPIGLIYILISNQDKLATKLKHLCLFSFVSFLPVFLYLIRNYIISKSLFGYNPTALGAITLYRGAVNTYNETVWAFVQMLSWYIPEKIVNSHPHLLLISFLATGFSIAFLLRINRNKLFDFFRTYPMMLFVSTYTGFFLLLKGPGGGWYEARILAPLFVPTTLMLFIVIENISKYCGARLSRSVVNLSLICIIAIWSIYPAKSTVLAITNQVNRGAGYTGKSWTDSQTLQYLFHNQALESKCIFYTNDGAALYILANLKTQSLPAMDNYKLAASDLSKLRGSWPNENNACLILFNKNSQQYTGTINQLRMISNLSLVVRLKDGAIYTVTRK